MTILRVDTISGIGTTTFGPTFNGNLEFNSQNYIVLPKGSSTQQGVLRTTDDVIGVGGTFYDNLVLAMPFNQATGLRDVSSRNRNPGAYGNVAISTAQSKYYGSSAYFDGTGDYLSVGDSNDFSFGTGDFTLEYWINTTDTDFNFMHPDSEAKTTGYWGHLIQSSSFKWNNAYNSTNLWEVSAIPILNGGWHHCAICRASGVTKVFFDGVSQSTTGGTFTDGTNYSGTTAWEIGGNGNLNDLTGYLQDLRVYKGLAKYTANFTPPDRIAEIGVGFTTGQLRYNTDSNLPELYDGNQWVQLSVSQVGLGTGGDTEPGARGLVGGGGPSNVIQYINIASTGNAQDFGDLLNSTATLGACASSTRGVFLGGGSPVNINNIDYVTIASTGNAQDFGDLINAGRADSCASNSTRGLRLGSTQSPAINNTIEYITIASTGNAQDFGDTTQGRAQTGAFASPTRAVNIGGYSGSNVNTIDFVTISTLGNAFDFGDCNDGVQTGTRGCSNSIRGLFGGGYNPSPYVSEIDYLTIATTGNSVDFGNLSVANRYNSSCSSSTRGIFALGETPSPGGNVNTIEYVIISTQSNSVDFGDLLTGTSGYLTAATSNAHGGL